MVYSTNYVLAKSQLDKVIHYFCNAQLLCANALKATHLVNILSMQTISSGLFTGNSKETSGHKRSADLTLLLHREVLGCTCITRYKSCPRYRTGTG